MTAINQPTITRIELSRVPGKKNRSTTVLARTSKLITGKKYRLPLVMATVVVALGIGISSSAASVVPPVQPSHIVNPIGVIGFNGNGQITENLNVHGLQVRLSATLEGDELTTVASSKFGSHSLTRVVPTGNPVIFAVPNGTTKPLVLTSFFNQSATTEKGVTP